MRISLLLAVLLLPLAAGAQQVDQYGRPIQQVDQYGNPIQQVDQYGNPIQQQAYPQQQYAQPGYDQPPPVEEQAPQYGYVGPHPEPYDAGSAPCYIQGPHFHPYAPFDQYLFREAGGYFYFIGDLGDFSYSGQLFSYAGNHPLPAEYGGGYCYINWQHRHHFPAPPSMAFRYTGGVYSYVGAWDPLYYSGRDAWSAYYNGYYRSSYYGGRYWTVRPPHIYRPSYGWGAPGVYRPGITVRGPGGVSVTVGGHQGYGYGHPGYAPGYGHPGYAPGYAHPGYVEPRPSVAAPGRPGEYVAPPPPGGRPTVAAPGRPAPARPAPPPQRRPGQGVASPPPR